jgi:hypothetical protein
MATKTVYITVRLDIDNPNVDEITDEDAQEIIDEMDYRFEINGKEIDSEICGINE